MTITTAHRSSTSTGGVVTLTAPGVELIIDLRGEHPVIAYWGAPLGAHPSSEYDALFGQAYPHADLDEPLDAGVMRERSRGFHGRPALSAHREGTDWSTRLITSVIDASDRSLTAVLVDRAAGVELVLSYRLEGDGVLLIESRLRNSGITPLVVDELSTWLPLPDRAKEIVDFSGRWLRERQMNRRPIGPGALVREGREGRTGHDATIVQCAVTSGADVDRGEVWSMALMWSGNTRHMIEQLPSGRASIGAGELLEPGEVVLAPGAEYAAPTVLAVYSREGLDGMGSYVHEWLRARPEHPTRTRPRPVTLNVWEAVYFDHHHERLVALAEAAAEVGVERFVLDDGWFGARRNDKAGLGDWTVSPAVWPHGLRPLADRVRELGMEFGLWFEGEMINPDSDLYRSHPEWILHTAGRVPPTARNQLVIDLCNPAAYQHILETVHAVIAEVGVSYIKWDHNRSLVEPGHEGRAAARRQTLALYNLFDELKRRSPGLEIESCASGGGRIDLGMALHVDRFWTSDSNDALERQEIQRWSSLVIPPEMLGTHIGPTISHSTGRRASIQFRAVTALFGHAGLEWNLLEATPEERASIGKWTAFYRAQRDLLHSGKVTRLVSADPAVQAAGVVAHDQSRAVFGVAQLRTSSGSRPDALCFSGLDVTSRYSVSVVDFGGAGTVQHRPPAWMTGAVLSGAALSSAGLRMPILRPEEAILIVLERVDH